MNRHDFPFLEKKINNNRIIYFDNAATTQKPQQLLDSLQDAYFFANANVHRASHFLSNLATQHHEGAREKIARYLNVDNQEIIFTKGTTDGINTIALLLEKNKIIAPGDEIIISFMEHHSNIVPWQMICNRINATLKILQPNEKLENIITPKTKIVSMAHISNVLGVKNPIEDIIALCNEKNIVSIVDAAQSVPHVKVDVGALNCDFLVFSAHKMYGPTGLGVLFGKKKWLEMLEPIYGGGEMIEKVTFEKTTYNNLPYKFEAGTPDFISTYAFGNIIEYIQYIGIEQIEKHERELTEYAQERLQEINDIIIYAQEEPKYGIISLNIKNIHPFDIATLLDEKGIAVRTGHHCAEPLMKYLKTNGTLRISFALYNEKEEIDLFIDILKQCIALLK